MINISTTDLEAIASRKNFKGEEFYNTSLEAFTRAKERSLTTTRTIYVAESEADFMVYAHGVELKGYTIINKFKKGESMMNLAQAKKQADTLSMQGKKIYVVENGVNDYMTSNAPFKGHIGYYLNGEFTPETKNVTINTMAKTAKKSAKKTAKKTAKKVAAPKKAAKKVAAKKAAKGEKPVGKIVDISIADMRKKMADGYYYKDPQGTRQSENYLASRAKQDLVRSGMQEFKA